MTLRSGVSLATLDSLLGHPFSRTKKFADEHLEPVGDPEAAGVGVTAHVEVVEGLCEQLCSAPRCVC